MKVDKELLFKNDIFKQIVEDKMFEGILKLNEKVKRDAFRLLINYYEGKHIAIKGINICYLLLICFYYHEEDLLEVCMNYILYNNKPDVNMTITLLNVVAAISKHEKYQPLLEYLKTRCIICFNQIIRNHISEIDPTGIIFILQTDYLEVDSENLLVDQIKWYYDSCEEDLDEDEDFKRITSLINWNRVDDNHKNYKLFIKYSYSQTVNHDRMYILEFPEFSKSNVFIDVLKKYYFNNFEFDDIESDMFCKFELIYESKWILERCLLSSNIKLTFSVLRCLSDAKHPINNILDEEQIQQTMVLLLREYETNSHNLKDNVMRCLTVFEFSIYLYIYFYRLYFIWIR